MKRSSTDHQISTSFKRVKISTSPGELRLHRDIQLLTTHNPPWTPSQNNPPNSSRLLELTRQNATIQRDPVDPLRLRLVVSFCQERWTFCLEMPRMYPHLPPGVSRVWRENLLLSSSRVDGVSNASSSLMVASSMMQRGEAPVPEKVVIRCLPPGGEVCCDKEEGSLCELDFDTAVYREWSPVSSLGDLIDFLIKIPERRRMWWSDEVKRRKHLQSVMTPSVANHWMHSGAVMMCPTPQSTRMSQFSTMMVTSSPQKCHMGQQIQVQQYPSSPCDMEEDSLEAAIEGSPFIANRFDVGYERGSMMRHWGVR